MDRIKNLIKQGEGIRIEFKEAKNQLPTDTFDTICAFLNRDGGDLLLGVNDKGDIIGINDDSIDKIKRDLVNQSNNTNKLNPPFILFPKVVSMKNKTIIHVQVAQSSQIHKCKDIVYDRSEDGDFRVTDPDLIAKMVNRKRVHYTESIIYPAIRFSDFKTELFNKSRNLIRSNQPNHPWLTMNDQQMLAASGLYKQDFKTGEQGYTLAAILLFGKDIVIQQILPHYKIDALVRIENVNRYDDRLIIQTNLFDAYDKLMGFIQKHLPDKFYMEGNQRLSLRDNIFREVVANLIVHREYTNALPSKFIIYRDRVEIENANNPHGQGPISVRNFTPFPKNPVISKFFMQLGLAEELGSGVINVNRLIENYAPGKKPQFIEGNVFKTIIPIQKQEIKRKISKDSLYKVVIEGLNVGVSEGVKKRIVQEVKLIRDQKLNVSSLAELIGIGEKTIKRDIKLLKDAGLVKFSGAAKTGHYELTSSLRNKFSP